MRHLPKDRRGYPIPVNVLIDNSGKPHFTINDEERRQEHLTKHLCPLCGQKLLRGRWTLGGPASAFMEEGGYIDPPMHYECYRYAAQVCPYLALPSFTKRIDAKTLDPKNAAGHAIFMDDTVFADRPDLFVAVMHVGELYHRNVFGFIQRFKPKGPYRNIEYWRNGVQLSNEEGEAASLAYLERRGMDIVNAAKTFAGPRPISVKI